MLTGMKIAIIGGDARQLEIINELTKNNAELMLIGFEQLNQHIAGTKKVKIIECDFSSIDAIVLPVSGTDLSGKIEAIFSNETIMLTDEMIGATKEHCKIYSGIANSYLINMSLKNERNLIQLFDRDDVAIYNSIPTVEGTIMMAIQNTDVTIHGSNVAVLGLGRVGMSVARAFDALGANVKVGARKSEHLARITEMGLKPFHLKDLQKEIKNVDICINTIPSLVIDKAIITQMPINILIIDLASKPGGTDFSYAKKRGIKALLAPGLPGIVAPKSAGQILAKVLLQLLKESTFINGSD